LRIIEWDCDGDRDVHHDVVQHERQCIKLLPQTMRIIQESWKQLYNKDEHYHLQHALIDELKNKSPS